MLIKNTKNFNNLILSSIKNFSTSTVLKNSPIKPTLVIDNSLNKDNILKSEGLYQIYNNIYLNENFIENLSGILEYCYDNSEDTTFKFFFFGFPSDEKMIIDLNRFIKHLASYPTITLRHNNCKVYKNTGLLFSFEFHVFMEFYNIEYLKRLSDSVLKNIIFSTIDINNHLNLDHKNTVHNLKKEFNFLDEIILFIHADSGLK